MEFDAEELWLIFIFGFLSLWAIMSFIIRLNENRKILQKISFLEDLMEDSAVNITHKIELLDKSMNRTLERDFENRLQQRLENFVENKPKAKRGRPRKTLSEDK